MVPSPEPEVNDFQHWLNFLATSSLEIETLGLHLRVADFKVLEEKPKHLHFQESRVKSSGFEVRLPHVLVR